MNDPKQVDAQQGLVGMSVDEATLIVEAIDVLRSQDREALSAVGAELTEAAARASNASAGAAKAQVLLSLARIAYTVAH